jgi:nucleotide-binding universal stress UspA family protein
MYTRILVPLDGSARAEQAIPVAARLARATYGTVILLEVIQHNVIAAGLSAWQVYSDSLFEDGQARAVDYLEKIGRMPELASVPTEIHVEYGEAASSILAAVESYDIDCIVLCSHGYTGVKRWALGSVTRKIIPHSSVPVLVLRDAEMSLPIKPLYALVALDGSPLSEEILAPTMQLLAALAPFVQKTLHLTHVVKLSPSYGSGTFHSHIDQMREAAKRQAHAYLAAVAERLTTVMPDLTVTTSVSVNIDVAEALVQAMQQQVGSGGHFDLVAMATHGRSGLEHLLMGSVTEQVMNATNLPMLVVRSSEHSKHTLASAEAVGAIN